MHLSWEVQSYNALCGKIIFLFSPHLLLPFIHLITALRTPVWSCTKYKRNNKYKIHLRTSTWSIFVLLLLPATFYSLSYKKTFQTHLGLSKKIKRPQQPWSEECVYYACRNMWTEVLLYFRVVGYSTQRLLGQVRRQVKKYYVITYING